MKYKNYLNNYTFNRKIYSAENILEMTLDEILSKDKELIAQYNSIGTPSNRELNSSRNVVYIHEYTRDDGTEVRAHWRSKPNTGSIIGGITAIDNIINDRIEQYLNLPSSSLDTFKYIMDKGLINSNSMNLWEKFQGFVYEQVPGRLYSNFSKLLRDAIHNFSDAKKNKNARIVKGILTLDKNIQNEIKRLGGSNNSIGVVYNENSEISKLFSNSPNLEEFIKKSNNLENIINNKYSKGIPFEFGKKNLLLIKEYDRYSSLQHARIINPKIENGYMTGTLVDYYDFSKRANTIQNIPNNWGYDQQQKGILKNYYICVKIKLKI